MSEKNQLNCRNKKKTMENTNKQTKSQLCHDTLRRILQFMRSKVACET